MSEPILPMLTFTIAIDPSLSEKEFVSEVVRQAREEYRRARGVILSKGGRPSLAQRVQKECDKIWKDWGERFPHNQSMQNLIEAVARKIPGGRKDLTTIERNVQAWIRCNLSLYQVPDGWLRTPEGKRLLRMQLAFAAMGLQTASLDDLNSLSDKELARRFIEARRSANKR